jgi:hypothetical protein
MMRPSGKPRSHKMIKNMSFPPSSFDPGFDSGIVSMRASYLASAACYLRLSCTTGDADVVLVVAGQ